MSETHTAVADLLVHHQQTRDSGCHCGWGDWGRSFTAHIATVLDEAGLLRQDPEPNPGPRLARYTTRVYATNRRPETGEPLAVLAASRDAAIARAIELGWSGQARDARVYISRVDDIEPTGGAL